MKVLHFYPNDDGMIAQYVTILQEYMGMECTNDMTHDTAEALQLLRHSHYDILHLHGCWHHAFYRVARQALKLHTRLVLTPHGQLEPWVMSDNYWKEKLPKRIVYQQTIVSKAYAVIIQGKMEEECMQKLGWNSRTVVVRNGLITNSTTKQQMAARTFAVYRRVQDSNTWELMTDDTRQTFRQLLKAGITGDVRWLRESPVTISDDEQWRRLMCYAHQEQVERTIDKGLRILKMTAPETDMSKVSCFLPDGYEPSETIESAIGMQFATENDRLLATFRHLKKLIVRKRLTLTHLVELDKELRQHDSEEDQLCETLSERRLYTLAARLMYLMSEFTGLDEGFMPMPPLSDRVARRLKIQIRNHLMI